MVPAKLRADIIHLAKAYDLTLLAEKVETREEHQACVLEGFKLFQGYYYSKPVVVSGIDIPFFLQRHIFKLLRNYLCQAEK